MAEYIERQTVVDMLQNLSYDDWNQGAPTTWANAFSECAEMIRDIPPADVRPVDVGLWLRVGNTGLASCRCGFITDRYSTYRYCPNCGRKNGGVEYGG